MPIFNFTATKSYYICNIDGESITINNSDQIAFDMDTLSMPELRSLAIGVYYNELETNDNDSFTAYYTGLLGDISNPNSSGGLTESQVNALIDTKLEDFTPSGGGGFSFGGEWDATGTEVLSTAQFNVLTDCTVSGNTLVPSASQFGATSQNLSKTDVGTQMTFKVTWPDTSAGFFMLGLHTSSLENALAASNDETASFVGIGAAGGTVLALLRDGTTVSQDPAGISINAGDVVILGYRPAVSLLYISNETQNTFNILQLSLYPDFQTSQVNLALYAQLNTAIAFEFPSEYSMQQVDYSLELPTDFTKTYLVSAANINSAVNGKLLKQGDFVFFFEHDSITDVLVSRLLTDNDINSLVEGAAQAFISQELQENGSIYNAIAQYVDDSTTGAAGHAAIQTAIESSIQNYADGIGVGGGNQPYATVMDAAEATISNEIESGGIIDTAIQAAINP